MAAQTSPPVSPIFSHWQKRKTRTIAAMRSRCIARVQCKHCERWFSENGMPRHLAICSPSTRETISRDMNHCTCGRMKTMPARCCFNCEEKDVDLFLLLDRLIRSGITTPRAILEARGVPI